MVRKGYKSIGVVLGLFFIFGLLYLFAFQAEVEIRFVDFPIVIDFEEDKVGDYTSKNIKEEWPNVRMLWGKADRLRYAVGLSPVYTEIVGFEGGQSLKVNYAANHFGPINGAQFSSSFPKIDEAVLSYRVFVPDDFDFVLGGKLPGLAGGEGNAGGKIPNGYDGWSCRLMFSEKGEIAHYLYYPGQTTSYGEYHFWENDSTRVKLEKGKWSVLTHYIKMNSPKKRDGVLKAWYNGVLVLELNSIRFRDTCSLGIDHLLFSTFYGGDSIQWAPNYDTYLLFDDFMIEPVTTKTH